MRDQARGARRGAQISEPEDVASGSPELDREDDPRGGALAWALLAVGVALLAGILLLVGWLIGAW